MLEKGSESDTLSPKNLLGEIESLILRALPIILPLLIRLARARLGLTGGHKIIEELSAKTRVDDGSCSPRTGEEISARNDKTAADTV